MLTLESLNQEVMNWETLPPLILEKIIYYSADYEYNCTRWLLLIKKFGRVSGRWKSAITTSKKLFSDERNQLVLDNKAYLYDIVDTQGTLIRHLIIDGLTCPFRVKRVLESIKNAENYVFLEKLEISIEPSWTLDNVKSVMNFLNRCPKLFCVRFNLYDKLKCTQQWAVRLWELLLCTVHCNSLPKMIFIVTDYNVDIGEMISLDIDWSFISSYNYEGIGSVKELKLELDPNVNEISLGQGPLWCYLTEKVKLEQLTIIRFGGKNRLRKHSRFLSGMKTDCLKVEVYGFDSYKITQLEKAWFQTFKILHIVDDIKQCPAIIDTMTTIQHPNFHFVIDNLNDLLVEIAEDTTRGMRFIDLAIEALQTSSVKTLRCSKPDW